MAENLLYQYIARTQNKQIKIQINQGDKADHKKDNPTLRPALWLERQRLIFRSSHTTVTPYDN